MKPDNLFLPRVVSASLMGLSLIFLYACGTVRTPSEQAAFDVERQQRLQPKIKQVDIPFDVKEHKQAMRPGNSTIKGVLYHGLGEDGHPTFFSRSTPLTGIKLVLLPDSAYWRRYIEMVEQEEKIQFDWLIQSYGKHLLMPPQRYFVKPHAETANMLISATTDSFGRYSFSGLSPGKYLIFSHYFTVNFTERARVRIGSDRITGDEFFEYRNFDNDWSLLVRNSVSITENRQGIVNDVKAQNYVQHKYIRP